jgi:hypothetical protein
VRRLIVLGIAFAACEKAGDGRKTIEVKLPKLTVTLVDAGAEPRAPLRFHFKAGSVTTFEETSDGTTHHRDSRVTHEGPVHERVEVRVVAVEPDGHFQQHSRAAHDVEQDTRVDARGRVESSVTTYPSGNDHPPPSPFYEHGIVFPEEAVGPGAHWRFVAEADHERATVDATLVSVQHSEIEVRTTFVGVHPKSQVVIDLIGTTDLHIDLAGGSTTLHTQERMSPEGRGGIWSEDTIDVVPVP